ncbi:hypothetical protein [Aneurinibacillus aneurinilyticus]|uniref:SWIM-type domain-containing protein n=1 Tax=Aneurinibacillus aneurinilyticus TaxID=1391 RepID=A0A848CYT1_ANEAE|nr:hypothetical protein [Aneurinibacillus aneurinilyticus]NMF00576.1 hypothetical protein [Aneurinibacillus aneurinilyticus]
MVHVKERFEQFIALCSEEYLTTHANKGLYKRAIKEIEKGTTVHYEFSDEHVNCTLNDGTLCQLQDRIDKFLCSCPSDKICKHVIIAILYYTQTEELVAEERKGDFTWLLALSAENICKHFSEVQIDEVLFRLHYPEEIETRESGFLAIKLKEQNIEVTFEEEADFGSSTCSCKAKESCVHRLESLLRYRLAHHVTDMPVMKVDVNVSMDVVEDCKRILAEIISFGLAKLPQGICDRLEVLAIAARTGNLPNLERGIRGLHGELDLFFKRHVRFSKETFLRRLTEAYVSAIALEKELPVEQMKQVIGRFRSKYYTIPRLELYALGANPWETRSGYKGITYYFYALGEKRIYTYTDARPVYYEDARFQFAEQYRKTASWSGGMTMHDVSKSHIILRNCKVNRERRLSASEETLAIMLERRDIEDMQIGSYLVTDWRQMGTNVSLALFGSKQDDILLLQVKKIKHIHFEQATQNLLLTAEDKDGNTLDLTIAYTGELANRIRHLEKSRELRNLHDFYILVQRYGTVYYPISFLKGTMLTNIKLDV